MVYFENFMNFKKFLSGCLVLEELHTKYIHLSKVRAKGFETSLSNLVRATISPFDIPLKAIYNVEFLYILKVRMCHQACFVMILNNTKGRMACDPQIKELRIGNPNRIFFNML
jgi:hypothetical protein